MASKNYVLFKETTYYDLTRSLAFRISKLLQLLQFLENMTGMNVLFLSIIQDFRMNTASLVLFGTKLINLRVKVDKFLMTVELRADHHSRVSADIADPTELQSSNSGLLIKSYGPSNVACTIPNQTAPLNIKRETRSRTMQRVLSSASD